MSSYRKYRAQSQNQALEVLEQQLHGDGVVGVLFDVPARGDTCVGKEGAAAGKILFGAKGVNLVLDFVGLARDSEEADAVNRAIAGTELGNVET